MSDEIKAGDMVEIIEAGSFIGEYFGQRFVGQNLVVARVDDERVGGGDGIMKKKYSGVIEFKNNGKLYNVLTMDEKECYVIDENVTREQADYLRHWHNDTNSKTRHWMEESDKKVYTPDPVGFDLETIARNEFEENRAKRDARAKWVDRDATHRHMVATGDLHGFTAVSPQMGGYNFAQSSGVIGDDTASDLQEQNYE